MSPSSDSDPFVLLKTCYDQATAMTVQSVLESERIEVIMKRMADRSIEGHARGPTLEVRAMVRGSDLAAAAALLEAFDSAEIVPSETVEGDPNDRSLQQFRERMRDRGDAD